MSSAEIKLNHEDIAQKVNNMDETIDFLRESLKTLNKDKENLLSYYRGDSSKSFIDFSKEEYESFSLIITELHRLSLELQKANDKFEQTDSEIQEEILNNIK